MQSKNSPDKVRAAERRKRAVELRVAGRSYVEIAQELGCSFQRAAQLVAEAMQRLNERTVEQVADLRRIELERLDTLQKAIWDKAAAGDKPSILAVLKIIVIRGRLLGLNAPVKVEGRLRGSRDVADLTPEELAEECRRMGIPGASQHPNLLSSASPVASPPPALPPFPSVSPR